MNNGMEKSFQTKFESLQMSYFRRFNPFLAYMQLFPVILLLRMTSASIPLGLFVCLFISETLFMLQTNLLYIFLPTVLFYFRQKAAQRHN